MTDFDSPEANYAVAQATEFVIASHNKFTHEDTRNRHLREVGFLINLGGLSLTTAAVFYNQAESLHPFGDNLNQAVTFGLAAVGVGSLGGAIIKGYEAVRHHVRAQMCKVEQY